MKKNVLIIGALDTKGPEYALLRDELERLGCATMLMNVGVIGESGEGVEIGAEEVAKVAGSSLGELREAADRGSAMQVMARGAAAICQEYVELRKCDAVVGMGGTGGSSVVCGAMRGLPLGMPKVCVSTMAGGDVSALTGGEDILLIPSVVDIAGLNAISELVIRRAAGVVDAMLRTEFASSPNKKTIAASMFGNTTQCVDACRAHFEQQGYDVLVFHATGDGGRTMEALIRQGMIDAVLDITTTELADELCGGIFTAGPERLDAAGRKGIPQVIVPGCCDMVNFGPPVTIPSKYKNAGRLFYEWNPATTLMRTSVEENQELGRILALKANAATGPTAVVLPLDGFSILDGPGGLFSSREADQACFDALRDNLKPSVPIHEVRANINAPEFTDQLIEVMEQFLTQVNQPQGAATV